jgi:hypothetical protein
VRVLCHMTNKQCYGGDQAAIKHAIYLHERHHLPLMFPYFCHFCQSWHLTRKEDSNGDLQTKDAFFARWRKYLQEENKLDARRQ